MNIETIKALKERAKEMLEDNYNRKIGDEEIYTIICELENFYTAYEKEKEKNERAEELYMQHNPMIIDILKECDYMIKNRYYMNDVAIRQHTENIKNIAKYYIKEPEWIKIKEK